MGFFLSLIISLVIYVIGALLNRPSLENAKATPFDEARFPDIDPRKKIPIGWGTPRFSGPYIADIVNYRFVKIRKKVKTSPFTKKKVTIGYRYFVGMHLAVARAASTPYTLRQIYWEEKLLFDGTVTHSDSGNNIVINEPEFLGGEEKGGGLVGTMRFYGGGVNQNVDSYIESFHGANETPAYRGTAMIVLEDFEIGESPNIAPIQFVMSRFPNFLGLTNDQLLLGPSDLDINPIAIYADLLRETDYGLSLPTAQVNGTELTTLAETIRNESPQLGASLKWANNEAIKKLFAVLQELIDGVFFYFDGSWTALLTRPDYTVGALPVYDDDINSKLIRFGRTDPSQITNTVEIIYNDREIANRPSPIFNQDSANFERAGRNKGQQIDFPTVWDPDVANFLAGRELHSRGIALANIELEVNRQAYNLKPSEPFVYNNPTLGIVQLVMRAAEIALGTPRNRTIRVRAIEDVFGIGAALIDPPVTEPPPVVQDPQVIVTLLEVDMPYLFNLVDEEIQNPLIPGETHKPSVWPVQPQGNALGYFIEARPTFGSGDYVQEDELDYGAVGVLASTLNEGTVDTLATLILNNVQQASLVNPTITDNERRNSYLGHIIVFSTVSGREPEILAYESAVVVGTTVTLSNVHRALQDTLQQRAIAGDFVAFFDGQGTTVTSNYPSTANIGTRYINSASSGDAAASVEFATQMRNRVNRPFPAANFQINGSRYPDSPVPVPPVPAVLIPVGDITFTWDDRDRLDNISREQGEGSVTMETGLEYRLQIYEEDAAPGGAGNLLRTETIAAGVETYVYTEANILADGGPFEYYRVELRAHPIGTPTVDENIQDNIRRFRYEGGASFGEVIDTEYLEYVLGTSPAHYFPLNGPAGTNESNLITAVQALFSNEAINGSYSLVGDFNGNNVSLAGKAGDYVLLPDHPDWDLADAFTIIMTFAVGQRSATQAIMMRENGVNANETFLLAVNSSGEILVNMRATSGAGIEASFTSATAFPGQRFDDGQPVQIAIRKANGSAQFGVWIKGSFAGFSTGSIDTLFASSEPFTLGPDATSSYLTPRGLVGHWILYNSELASDDIRAHWVNSWRSTPFDTEVERLFGFVGGWFRLNQGVGANDASLAPGLPALVPVGPPTTRQGTMLKGLAGVPTRSNSTSFNGSTDYMTLGAIAPWVYTHGGFIIGFNTSSATTQIWFSAERNNGATQQAFRVGILSTGEVYVNTRINTAANDYLLTTQTGRNFADGQDHWVFVQKTAPGNPMVIWVDGIPYSIARGNAAQTINGTGSALDWISNIITAGGGFNAFVWNVGAFFDTINAPLAFTNGRLQDFILLGNVAVSDARVTKLLAAARGDLRSVSDVLLDEAPEHLFEIFDFANNDDILDNMAGVQGIWQNTGLGEETDQVPLAIDDLESSIYIPRDNAGAGNATYLRFAQAFLEALKGTGNFHDFGYYLAFQQEDNTEHIVLGNTAPDGNHNVLQKVFQDGTEDVLFISKFPPSNGNIRVEPGTQGFPGLMDVIAYREEFIGGGSPPAGFAVGDRRGIVGRREPQYATLDDPATGDNDTGLVEIFSGTAMTVGNIGTWDFDPPDNDRNLGGLLQRVAWWGRAVTMDRLLRNTLRTFGWNEHVAAIRALEPALYVRLNENVVQPTVAKNYGRPVPAGDSPPALSVSGVDCVFGLRATGGDDDANVWTERQGYFEGNRTGAFADAWIGLDGSDVPFSGGFVFPFAVGGWLRPDFDGSGFDNALISWGDDGSQSRLVVNARADTDIFQVGTQNNGGATQNDNSIAFPGGLDDVFRFVIFQFTNATTVEVYVNGDLFDTINLSQSAGSGWTPDRFRINAQAFNGSDPSAVFNASYHDIFVYDNHRGEGALTEGRIRNIYAQALQPSYDLVVEDDAPIAFWKLNEWEVADTYRNFVRDSNGVIVLATATGVPQAAKGIIAEGSAIELNDNCVDFDGTGQIDTNWNEYPVGSSARTFEGWLEAGFQGTWFSMGANVDLQALVVSVAANGDVTVNIRGAGEQLTFTSTGINTGNGKLVGLTLDGTTLNDFRLWVDGVEITTTSGGSASVVATVATLDLFIGSDVTDIGAADATGKASRLAVYDSTFTTIDFERHASIGGNFL